jgi:hypothetical protein
MERSKRQKNDGYAVLMGLGILRKSSGFRVFAEIFSKNIVIPSKDIPFFGEAPKRFWAIIAKFGFLRMTRITEFGDSVFFGFVQEHITREFPSTLTSQIKIFIVVYYIP